MLCLSPRQVTEWQYYPANGFMSALSVPALSDDGTIYFSCLASNRYIFKALDSSGGLTWEAALPTGGGYKLIDSPKIAADGTVYFRTGDGIYALKGSAPIMDSSWPVYGGNVRGTWRVQQLPIVPSLPSQAITRGGTLTLNAASTGPQPIRYQWLKDGERVPNATNSTLSVTDLRGFDSGVYQVRVSNPTGDRLSQPANLKVSFDPLPFVNIGRFPEVAFANVPPSANTRRDSWQFFHGINETNRTGRYTRMEIYTNAWQTLGLTAWSATNEPLAAAGYNANATAVAALGASIPPGRVFLNPGNSATGCVSLAFQAELAGYYSVTGRLSRMAVDASGDGVRWYLDVGALNVASGILTNTVAETNLAVAGIYLNHGEMLHLLLSAGSNSVSDLTGVELAVQLTGADPNSEPGFLQSPQNLAVLAGQNAAFSAVIDGFPEPTLQWQRSLNNGATWGPLFDGSEFTGVNTTNLQVYAVTLESSGQLFRIEAINAAGSAVSGVARLTVTDGLAAPSFVTQPEGLLTIAGGLTILSAQASGSGPLSYQWYHDGQALSAQSGATLTLNSTSPADAGSYYVVVANAVGSQTSAVASLSVDATPPHPAVGITITTNGAEISLQSVAGTQWKIQRASTLGASWETLASRTVDSSGQLLLLDTNPPAGSAFYRAKLDLPPTFPEITAQPLSAVLTGGSQASLSILVEGANPFSFQWWKNGTALSGETNQMLLISGVVTNHAGGYFVVASNAYGAVTSQVAVVTVVVPPTIVKVENIAATATSELKSFGRILTNLFSDIARHEVWESVGVSVFGVDPSPAVTFDLQGIYRLTKLRIWNGPEVDPSIKSMVIEYSVDGARYDSLGEKEVASGTGAFNIFGEDFDLESIEARYVRFTFLENYAGQVFPVVGTPTVSSLVMIDQAEFYGEFLAAVPPEILTQSDSFTNCLAGIAISLNVAVQGAPPLTYQWWHDGNLVTNGTNSTLNFTALVPADAGLYSLTVTNAGGEIVSAPALITVNTNVSQLALPAGGLLAYYPFNNSANDLSGNGHHAQNVGTKITRDRFGVLGGAYAFTRSSPVSYMTVVDLDPDNFSTGFSFGCWFRPDSVGEIGLIYWDPSGSWGLTYVAHDGDGCRLRCGSGSPSTDHSVYGLLITQGRWNHVMVTHGTAFDRLYLNGKMAGEWPTLPLQNNATPMYIGNGYLGSMDDVTIYGRELSAAEVSGFYTNVISGTPLITVGTPSVSPAGVQLSFSGSAGSSWSVERAVDLRGPWTNISQVLIETNGVGLFKDTNPPTGTGYYRARQP